MTVSLFQTSLHLTAIAAHCIILCGQPLPHHRRVHHRVHHRVHRAHGRCVPALITLALPISPRSHLLLDFLRLQKKRRALQPLLPSLHVCSPRSFQLSSLHFPAAVLRAHGPSFLSRIHAMPIDLDSPDWDPSPSALEELQSDPYTLPTAKSEQPDLPNAKLETVKDEPNDPDHSHHPSAVIQPTTVTTTLASPPPPKTPPIPAPSLSKHSTTHRTSTPRSSTGATSKPPPPSPAPTTSSEDPVILMTNVPILKKSRPGQPPHRLLSHLDHAATPKFGSRDHTATATSCPSTFRTTSSIIWTPVLTAPLPLRPHHHVQHHPRPTHQATFHRHRNLLHLPYFHHFHHYQNFHSLINRPANSPPPSCGLRAARLLQRLQTCWVTTSPEGLHHHPICFTQMTLPTAVTKLARTFLFCSCYLLNMNAPLNFSFDQSWLSSFIYTPCMYRSHLNCPLVLLLPIHCAQ